MTTLEVIRPEIVYDRSDEPAEKTSCATSYFVQLRWTDRALALGIFALILIRFSSLLELSFLAPLLAVFITIALPELYFLFYPILAGVSSGSKKLRLPSIKRLAIETLWAIALFVLLTLITSLIYWVVELLGFQPVETPDEIQRLYESEGSYSVYLYMLIGVMLAPVAEEVFFRGFLFNAFRVRAGVWLGMALSAFFFGFGHGYSSMYVLCVITVEGIFLSAVYWWRKTLVTPILIHTLHNLVAMLGILWVMFAYTNMPVMGISCTPAPESCWIESVAENSPADEAGLQVGDEIVGFNQYQIRHFDDLRNGLAGCRTGDNVQLTIMREDKVIQISVLLISAVELQGIAPEDPN